MLSRDAKGKLETLLADLQQGSSWLDMYKITAKACEEGKPLPHNFAMRRFEQHLSDKRLARIHWQQMGTVVAQHAKHLKQYNETRKQSQVASQYVVVAATERKHKALVTLLQNGTSWLNMYQATDKACGELSCSRMQEELAAGAKDSYALEVLAEGAILKTARENLNLHEFTAQ